MYPVDCLRCRIYSITCTESYRHFAYRFVAVLTTIAIELVNTPSNCKKIYSSCHTETTRVTRPVQYSEGRTRTASARSPAPWRRATAVYALPFTGREGAGEGAQEFVFRMFLSKQDPGLAATCKRGAILSGLSSWHRGTRLTLAGLNRRVPFGGGTVVSSEHRRFGAQFRRFRQSITRASDTSP